MQSKAYLVSVRTTNATQTTCHNKETDTYYDCTDGELYVISDDPRKIYDMLGKETVKCIKYLGEGYY